MQEPCSTLYKHATDEQPPVAVRGILFRAQKCDTKPIRPALHSCNPLQKRCFGGNPPVKHSPRTVVIRCVFGSSAKHVA